MRAFLQVVHFLLDGFTLPLPYIFGRLVHHHRFKRVAQRAEFRHQRHTPRLKTPVFIRTVGGPWDELVHFIKADNGSGHQYLGNQKQRHHVKRRPLRPGEDGNQQGQAHADKGRQGHRPQVNQEHFMDFQNGVPHPKKQGGLHGGKPRQHQRLCQHITGHKYLGIALPLEQGTVLEHFAGRPGQAEEHGHNGRQEQVGRDVEGRGKRIFRAGRGAQGHGNQQGQHRPFQQHGVQPHTAPHAPQEGAHGPDAEKPPELYDAAPGGGGKFQRAFIQRSGGAPFMMMPHHVAEPVAFKALLPQAGVLPPAAVVPGEGGFQHLKHVVRASGRPRLLGDVNSHVRSRLPEIPHHARHVPPVSHLAAVVQHQHFVELVQNSRAGPVHGGDYHFVAAHVLHGLHDQLGI